MACRHKDPGVTQTQALMSGTTGAAPPTVVLGFGMDFRGTWHQRAVQTSRALVQTYLLTSSVHPPAPAGGDKGTTLRLPSLVSKGPRRQSHVARLSLSEPCLLSPNAGFSSNRHPSVSQKRPPPPSSFSKSSVVLPSNTCHPSWTTQPHEQQNHQQVQSCSRPAFIHFSQAIQPSSKPIPVRRHSHYPVLTTERAQGDLRPSVMQYRHSSFQGEPLSIIGKPCLPSCSQQPPVVSAAGPTRTQLHVFLPTEAEGEEVDSESVDEGFMDELDYKITSLKLQQGAPKTVTYH